MTSKKILPDNVVLVNFNKKQPDRPDSYPKDPDIATRLNRLKAQSPETLPPDVLAELEKYQHLLSGEDDPES